MAKHRIEANKIIQKLKKQKSDRDKVTLYLSKQLLEDFRKKCGDLAVSQVIEELMREFIDHA